VWGSWGRQHEVATQAEMFTRYPENFADYIRHAVALEPLAPEMRQYDLALFGQCLKPARDHPFTYLGLQTLYDRYFMHAQRQHLELP
jgi:ribonucleoside-diphosphate reductase alpha chain